MCLAVCPITTVTATCSYMRFGMRLAACLDVGFDHMSHHCCRNRVPMACAQARAWTCVWACVSTCVSPLLPERSGVRLQLSLERV